MAKRTAPGYRELQTQLDTVVARLEDSQLDVDEATAAYEEGLRLIKQLQAHLQQAENRVSRARADFAAETGD